MSLSFSGNGVIAGLAVGGLPDGTVDGDTLASGTGGKVLQCLSTPFTSVFSSTSPDTFADISGFSVAITPAATSSKVLVTVSVGYEGPASNNSFFRLVRDSTAIALGDAAGSRDRGLLKLNRSSSDYGWQVASFTFLDSPSSTSALNYKLQIGGTGDSAQMYINRDHNDADSNESLRGFSSITVMEISG